MADFYTRLYVHIIFVQNRVQQDEMLSAKFHRANFYMYYTRHVYSCKSFFNSDLEQEITF